MHIFFYMYLLFIRSLQSRPEEFLSTLPQNQDSRKFGLTTAVENNLDCSLTQNLHRATRKP